MFAVTAVAGHRNTGAPEYFLVRVLVPGDPAVTIIDETNQGVVYTRDALIELLETLGPVVAFLPGVAPQPLRSKIGTHGYRYVTTDPARPGTGLLHQLPRFAFIREARAIDLAALFAIGGLDPNQPIEVPDDLVKRYVDFGWVRLHDDGEREVTALGRALLAYGDR